MNVFVEETVDKKFSDKMKASEVLKEVFVKCENCGKNYTRFERALWSSTLEFTKKSKIQVWPMQLPQHQWKGVKATLKDET